MGETQRVSLLVWLILLCYGTLRGTAVVDPTSMVSIPAGPFLMGSVPAEREYGYHLDETLHGSSTA
jgi:formylglycine-generating enzyme required for sulfatase activity